MASGGQKRTRSERVAALELPPGKWGRAWADLRRRDVLVRIGLCVLTAVVLCVVIDGRHPPFGYTTGYAPSRDVTARVPFEVSSLVGVEQQVVKYKKGDLLAEAGQPLQPGQLEVLRREHEEAVALHSVGRMLLRASAVVALVLALFALCGLYLHHRERRLTASIQQLALMLTLAVATVWLSRWAANDAWRAEIIPLLLFGQTVAIAYRRELALLFSGVVALVLVLALGHGLGALLVLMGATATAILQLAYIRSRSKLIYVAVFAGLAAFLLTLGMALLDDQPLTWALLERASFNVLWTLSAGFLMTGLLFFIERSFGVLTDISLLELGDMSKPLLQELVQRAPGTYNHSIIVGSIAEAAADAIGARGLLVRVGAYFHDIGKMLKPQYFVENQQPNENRHEALVPAMSTLVIIAHVKDGADLARQHKLPGPFIDFIEQHHGTTLVEYFYDRANEQRQADPNSSDVEESTFRYPGPKPQTKEAGVLMLADTAESACRSLKEPGSARIESLVRDVAKRKLDDDQFDESGLSLRELRAVEDSIIKSLIANYHGRVKYPDQKTT